MHEAKQRMPYNYVEDEATRFEKAKDITEQVTVLKRR